MVYVVGNRSYINRDGKISDPFYHDGGYIDLDKTCIQFIYRVYYDGELVCWGYVNAEDKTAPEIYCPDDKHYGQRSSVVYEIVGDLGENDDVADADDYNSGGYDYQFDPTIQTCFRTTSIAGFPTLDLLGNARYFDLHEFRVSATGIYTFVLNTQDVAEPFDYSGLGVIYQGFKDLPDINDGVAPFDPYQPCVDIIAFADYTFAPGPWSGLGEYLNLLGNINGWSIF
ncbi:MAG: hypothetical protein IPJ74_03475 [Saprospiraceae bacterium]|nr:hypothetical protein [Saprospiraceae bacterium]